MARYVPNFRRAIRGSDALDQPGAEISVEPFDARNVSTSAGMFKLLTTIRASRRHQANVRQGLADKELEREKTRAEIARIKAEATSKEQPKPANVGTVTAHDITTPDGKTYPAGTPVAEINLDRGFRKDAAAQNRVGRLSAARAGQAGIDQRIKTEVPTHVAPALQRLSPYLAALTSGSPELQKHSLEVIRRVTGLDFSPYALDMTLKGNQRDYTYRDVIANQNAARAELEKWATTQASNVLSGRYAPERARHQAVIDELSQGESETEPAADPAGLFE